MKPETDGKVVEHLGSILDMDFYQEPSCEGVYVCKAGTIVGYLSLGMSQGFGYISSVEDYTRGEDK